jgi:hypothetical protein
MTPWYKTGVTLRAAGGKQQQVAARSSMQQQPAASSSQAACKILEPKMLITCLIRKCVNFDGKLLKFIGFYKHRKNIVALAATRVTGDLPAAATCNISLPPESTEPIPYSYFCS